MATRTPTAKEIVEEAEQLIADIPVHNEQQRTLTPLLAAYLLAFGILLAGVSIAAVSQEYIAGVVSSVMALSVLAVGLAMEAMNR